MELENLRENRDIRPIEVNEGILFFEMPRFADDTHNFLADLASKGRVVRFHIPALMRGVVVSDPKFFTQLLGKGRDTVSRLSSVANPEVNAVSAGNKIKDTLSRLLGPESIFTAAEDQWPRLRGAAEQAFTESYGRMFEVMRTSAQNYATDLHARVAESETHEVEIDVLEEMRGLTLEIIQKILLGTIVADNPRAVSLALDELVGQIFADFSSPISSQIKNFLTPRKDRFDRSRQVLTDLVDKAVERIKSAHNNSENVGLIRNLVAAKLKDEELKSMILSFLLAGHETTASAMSWTLYELAQNPSVINNEERDEAGKSVADPELSVKNYNAKLQFLKLIIQESLRLHSVIPTLIREVKQPIEVDGVRFSKGEVLFVPLSFIQTNPAVWEDSARFNPNRPFLKDNFAPFAEISGRSCPGKGLAMMEMEIILAHLLSRFELVLPANSTVRSVDTFTRIPQGLRMNIKNRKK